MHAVSLRLVVGVWSEGAAAERALHRLRTADPDGLVGAVTLVVDQDGDLLTTDVQDAGSDEEGGVGALLGACLGSLTGGIGWLALDSGATGALAQEARRAGLRVDRLRDLGERMGRGSSALVAVVGESRGDDVVRTLLALGALTVPETLDDDLLAGLSARRAGRLPVGAVGDVIAIRSSAVVMRALDGAAAGMA
jgi:uncharacterized membrane protein